MELFKNKVGRPSNEIIKKRRMFIASIVLVIAVVLFTGCYALFSARTDRLTGATKNGSTYFDMHLYNNKVTISNCKIRLPIQVKNKQKKQIVIKSAAIHYVGKKAMETVKLNKTLAGKTEIWVYPEFNIKKFTSTTNFNFKVTLYFTVAGKSDTYYKYDLYSPYSYNTAIGDSIKKCTGVTTKKPAGTTKVTNANGRPVTTTKKTTKKTTKVTTKKPAGTIKTTVAAVKNGSTKINHYADSSDVWVTNDCKLAVQVDIENRTSAPIYITSAKITKSGDTNNLKYQYANISYKKTIAGGKGKKEVVKYVFPLTNIPVDYSLGLVTYFTNSGVKYWKSESIDLSKSVRNKISSCKKTTKPVTQPNLSTNLKCTSSMESVGSGNISCTTVAGALVEVFGQSPVSFMKTYTADSKGKISFSVPKEGSYLVQATKSGYTPTKYTVKVTKKKELKAGNKVTLKNGYFYSSATATKSATKTKKSGTYYIWSSTIKNGRIRITTKSGYAGKSGKITAWVNVSDLVY